jgi:formylglycine-generating enzyme required for sulfatase activity
MGTAVCVALDLTGNVMEWLATKFDKRNELKPEKDFTLNDKILLSYSAFANKKEHLYCGARDWFVPGIRYGDGGVRIVRTLRSSV